MKIQPLFTNLEGFEINDYFKIKGVKDIDNYTNFNTIEESDRYVNIEKARDIFFANNELDRPIYIVIDTDIDGFTSAAILYMFVVKYNSNVHLIYHNEPKAHGLNDVLKDLLQKPTGLIFVPDGGTNDVTESKELVDNGFEIVIIDHHHIEVENPYVCLVNNNLGDVNKFGSGALCVWHFCNYIEKHSVDAYKSYVMLSILGDSMDMRSHENATFVIQGKKDLHPYLEPFISYFNRGTISNKDYSFGLISKINATIRFGKQEDKQKLFESLIGLHNVQEIDLINFKDIHTEQNKEKDKVVKKILKKINELPPTNYNVIKLKKKTPLSGLIANTLLSKLNRTIFILTQSKDKEGKDIASGSVRSPLNIKDILNNSGLVIHATGHNSALGTSYHIDNEVELRKHLDKELSSCEPVQEVLVSCDIKDFDHNICFMIAPYVTIYGNRLEQPLLHIKNIPVYGRDWKVFKGGTLKLRKQNTDFLMFRSSEEKREELRIDKEDFYYLDVIVEPSLNVWNGNTTAQLIIQSYEVKEEL